MLIIHHLCVSQSERIVWLCEELGIPYELKLYHRSPVLAPPELKALTPMQAAPVINDGPLTLSESAAVAEYIIHKHGDGRLALPPSHPDYADYLYWFHFANGNLQPQVAAGFRLRMAGLDAENRVKKSSYERQEKVLAFMDERLGKCTWLAGEEFTAADVMTVFSLTTMRVFSPMDLSPYANILAYLKRVGEREGYKKAMAKGDPGMEPMLGGPSPEEFMKKLGLL